VPATLLVTPFKVSKKGILDSILFSNQDLKLFPRYVLNINPLIKKKTHRIITKISTTTKVLNQQKRILDFW